MAVKARLGGGAQVEGASPTAQAVLNLDVAEGVQPAPGRPEWAAPASLQEFDRRKPPIGPVHRSAADQAHSVVPEDPTLLIIW